MADVRIGVRAPKTERLDITAGGWLLVKKHLTLGESDSVYARMVSKATAGEKPELDPKKVGNALACEYLLDWNIGATDGKVIPINGLDPDAIAVILNRLDPDLGAEIREAIKKHDAAMAALRESEKNALAGASAA